MLAIADSELLMDESKRSPLTRRILGLPPEDLRALVEAELDAMGEEEVLAVLEHPFCTPPMISRICNQPRLTSHYAVRARLVAHRHTPRAHALKLIHYLFWADLLRMSTNVHIPPQVRRAIDTNLSNKLIQLTLGQKVSTARVCSRELIVPLLRDPSPRVFAALLGNPRLTEDDLIRGLGTGAGVTSEKIRLLADDPKWSTRYAVRKWIATQSMSPNAVAASQLRHLRRNDLRAIAEGEETSLFIRRCAQRLLEDARAGSR